MKIATRAQLITAVTLASIGLIAALVLVTYHEVDVANRQRQQASEIARGLSQLRLLTIEYRLYRSESARAQWYAVSDRVDREIAKAETSTPAQDRLLAAIRERRMKAPGLFAELLAAGAGDRAAPPGESATLAESTLLSRLLALQQENFADVFRLTDIATGRIDGTQRRLLLVVLAGLALIALASGLVSWLIHRGVLLPIVRLQRAASEIGPGNWLFNAAPGGNDELGRLAAGFQAMAERIEAQEKALLRGRDDLEREVGRRTAELRESEERLRLFVEHAPAALAMFDREMRYLTASRRWRSDYGLDDRSLFGMSHYEILPEIPEAWKAIHRRALAGEIVHEDNDRFERADGTVQWLRWEVRPWHDADGAVGGIVVFSEDITASVSAVAALRESEFRFRQVVESVPQLVWTCAPQGDCDFLSERWVEYTGIPASGQLGHGWIEQVHPDDRERLGHAWHETLGTGGEFRCEFRIRRRDGEYRWFDTQALPLRDTQGRIVKWFGTNTDVTERRSMDEALRARDLAQAANRLKSEFLANMSHELRTPLNAIIGFSELLVDGKPGPLTITQSDYLNHVLTSGRHLLQLINDVLDLSKVEAGKMDLYPEPFSPARAVEEVCSVVSSLAKRKNVAVRTDIGPGVSEITLDPQKFKQVLYNLLSNAVKFSAPGGQVEILVAADGASGISLRVRDNGIGIRPEEMGKLFVEFQQLESGTDRRHEGTGLGLALTKRIVELQYGTIGVESVLGKGSVFTVLLPAVAQEPAPRERSAAP